MRELRFGRVAILIEIPQPANGAGLRHLLSDHGAPALDLCSVLTQAQWGAEGPSRWREERVSLVRVLLPEPIMKELMHFSLNQHPLEYLD